LSYKENIWGIPYGTPYGYTIGVPQDEYHRVYARVYRATDPCDERVYHSQGHSQTICLVGSWWGLRPHPVWVSLAMILNTYSCCFSKDIMTCPDKFPFKIAGKSLFCTTAPVTNLTYPLPFLMLDVFVNDFLFILSHTSG